jgi:hypothetical protein
VCCGSRCFSGDVCEQSVVPRLSTLGGDASQRAAHAAAAAVKPTAGRAEASYAATCIQRREELASGGAVDGSPPPPLKKNTEKSAPNNGCPPPGADSGHRRGRSRRRSGQGSTHLLDPDAPLPFFSSTLESLRNGEWRTLRLSVYTDHRRRRLAPSLPPGHKQKEALMVALTPDLVLGALPSAPTPANCGAAALLGAELGAYAAGSDVVVVDVSRLACFSMPIWPSKTNCGRARKAGLLRARGLDLRMARSASHHIAGQGKHRQPRPALLTRARFFFFFFSSARTTAHPRPSLPPSL